MKPPQPTGAQGHFLKEIQPGEPEKAGRQVRTWTAKSPGAPGAVMQNRLIARGQRPWVLPPEVWGPLKAGHSEK